MASATWPASLPQNFVLGTTEQRQSAVERFPVDAGPAFTRRVFANVPRRMQWRVPPLTQDQRETLDAFFVTTLREGALAFNHVDPSTRVVAEYRFLEPPHYTESVGPSGPLWFVGLSVEIIP